MALSVIPKSFPDICTIPTSCQEHFLNLEAEAAQPLRQRGVNLAGHSFIRTGYEISRTLPRAHIALFTLDGEADFIGSNGHSGKMLPGNLLIFPAFFPHRYAVRKYWEAVWFHCRPPCEWNLFEKVESNRFHLLTALAPQSLKRAVDIYLDEREGTSPTADILSTASVSIICSCLDRELGSLNDTTNRQTEQKLARLWQKISGSLASPWTLDQLAEEVACTPQHLIRLMHKMENCTPFQKLANLRLGRAAQLLLTTDYKIEYIANLSGYPCPLNFARAFKRKYKMPPGAYRGCNTRKQS